MSLTALELKSKAEQCFKESKLDDAIKYYTESLLLDKSNENVLNSNLSACFYELGNYQTSLEYAEKVRDSLSSESIKDENTKKILDKNLVRIKKCQDLLNSNFSNIDKEKLELDLINLIPRYRPFVNAGFLEYYPFGHDPACSILSGNLITKDEDTNENSINEDSSEEIIEDLSSKINLNNLSKEELSSLRFFFGGFGDARHIFASLIDLNHEIEKLSIEKQDSVKATFVVNDIKPHAVAKLLIIIAALKKLNEFEFDKIGKEPKATRAAMLLVYVYVGNVMPKYIYDDLMDIIKSIIELELDSFNKSWSFFSINESSWISVKEVLKQWLTKCPASNGIMISHWKVNSIADTLDDNKVIVNQESQMTVFDQMKADYIESLKNTPLSEKVIENNKNELIKWFENMSTEEFMKVRERADNMENESQFKNTKRDFSFAKKHKYILPPFLIQEEVEKSLWFKNSIDCENSDELKYETFSFEEMTKYVKENWKPNVTIIDYDWYNKTGSHNLAIENTLSLTLKHFYYFSIEKEEHYLNPPNPKSLFDWFSWYFHLISKALSNLTKKMNCLKFEAYVGDINDIISTLNVKSKSMQQESSHKFNRISLSNVPDYTGLIHVFIECIPMLKKIDHSYIKCNVLLNTGMWKDYEHYVYAGSLMQSFEQCKAVLNVNKCFGGLWSGEGQPQWTHNSFDFKVSINLRNQVINWLTRVLLSCAYPSVRDSRNPMRESYSTNLTVFFRSIKYLINLGYPKHWIKQYLESIFANNLITAAKIPSKAPNKFHEEKELKKVDISKILMEVSTLAACYEPTLNLGHIECGKSLESITQYSIKFSYIDNFGSFLYSNVLGLIFEDQEVEEDDESPFSFLTGLSSKLRSEILKKKDQKQHLYSVVDFCSKTQTAKFWMSKKDHDEMVKNKWYVSLIRTDSWVRVSDPVLVETCQQTITLI